MLRYAHNLCTTYFVIWSILYQHTVLQFDFGSVPYLRKGAVHFYAYHTSSLNQSGSNALLGVSIHSQIFFKKFCCFFVNCCYHVLLKPKYATRANFLGLFLYAVAKEKKLRRSLNHSHCAKRIAITLFSILPYTIPLESASTGNPTLAILTLPRICLPSESASTGNPTLAISTLSPAS